MRNDKFGGFSEVVFCKYNELVELQQAIRKDPRKLKAIDLTTIKEDVKELNTEQNNMDYYTRYQSGVDVLGKVKTFIQRFDNDIVVEFEPDKENYTTVAISPYNEKGNVGKVYLWKSTYDKPDYIKFNITHRGECKIIKIFSQEQALGHKSFMFKVLREAIGKYNNFVVIQERGYVQIDRPIIMKIIADLSENTPEEKERYKNFFIKNGFKFTEKGMIKVLS